MTGVGRKPTDITICFIDCQCSWVQFHTGQRHTVRSFSAGAFASIALCTSVFLWSQLEHWTEHIVCWKFSLRYCIYVHFSQHLCRLVVTQCLSSTHTGIFIESASCFKCSLDNAKRSFSSVIQQCFWKSWSNCSNEVIVLLVKSKYFPVVFYRLETPPLHKYQYKSVSINYVINSTCMKIFNTRSQEAVDVAWNV